MGSTTINILAFGIAKEIIGASSIAIQAEEVATAGNIKVLLEEKYPRLKTLSSFMLAVNNEYAVSDSLVKHGDEVAIIPPVSGG